MDRLSASALLPHGSEFTTNHDTSRAKVHDDCSVRGPVPVSTPSCDGLCLDNARRDVWRTWHVQCAEGGVLSKETCARCWGCAWEH